MHYALLGTKLWSREKAHEDSTGFLRAFGSRLLPPHITVVSDRLALLGILREGLRLDVDKDKPLRQCQFLVMASDTRK